MTHNTQFQNHHWLTLSITFKLKCLESRWKQTAIPSAHHIGTTRRESLVASGTLQQIFRATSLTGYNLASEIGHGGPLSALSQLHMSPWQAEYPGDCAPSEETTRLMACISTPGPDTWRPRQFRTRGEMNTPENHL